MSDDTKNYRLHHTMIRIKDPERSKKFYQDILGMKLVSVRHFPEAKFSLYFYTYTDEAVQDPENADFKDLFLRSHNRHHIELTHNHGTENDDAFEGYKSGNDEGSKGFGHLCITVPDIYKACERFETAGVKVRRKPGPMLGGPAIAFIEDPDGYWIELVNNE